MPSLVAPTQRIKPARWTVNPAWVAPEWRWAWRGLELALLFWEDGGIPRDVMLSHDVVADGTPTWVDGPHGPALDFVSGDSDALRVDKHVVGEYPFTMSILGRHNTDSVSIYMSAADGSVADHFFILRSGSGNVGQILTSGGGGTDIHSGSIPLTGGNHYLLTAVFRSPTSRTLYVGGVRDGTATASQTPSGINNLGVQALFRPTPAYITGRDTLAAAWSRALTDSEVARLALDPFGPFRMGRRRVAAQVQVKRRLFVGGLAAMGAGR